MLEELKQSIRANLLLPQHELVVYMGNVYQRLTGKKKLLQLNRKWSGEYYSKDDMLGKHTFLSVEILKAWNILEGELMVELSWYRLPTFGILSNWLRNHGAVPYIIPTWATGFVQAGKIFLRALGQHRLEVDLILRLGDLIYNSMRGSDSWQMK